MGSFVAVHQNLSFKFPLRVKTAVTCTAGDHARRMLLRCFLQDIQYYSMSHLEHCLSAGTQEVAKRALSNMLGGLGHFAGQPLIGVPDSAAPGIAMPFTSKI